MSDRDDIGDEEAALNRKLFHPDGRPKRQPTGDYPIGNCRTPESGKFRPKGVPGGNRKGRQPGSRDLRKELAAELNRKVTIDEDGKVKRVTMRRYAVMQLALKALEGDMNACKELLNRDAALLLDNGPEKVRQLSDNDSQILDMLLNGGFDALPVPDDAQSATDTVAVVEAVPAKPAGTNDGAAAALGDGGEIG